MYYISDNKMNIYKDLARKCESYGMFLWTVGTKEPWMIEAGEQESETVLKNIYNSVHLSERQRLFVDMDGTLAEFKSVNTLETLYEKNYFLNLKPNENVLGAVKQIIANCNDIDVYILSAYLSDSKFALTEKNKWLDRYLPELPVEKRLFVPCGTDKSSVVPGNLRSNDYLLDDYTKNLNEWEPPAKGIKLINGINHTNGTWEGNRIRFTHSSEELMNMISDVMKEKKHFYEDRILSVSENHLMTKNEKITTAIAELTTNWNASRWNKACDEGCIIDNYKEEMFFIKNLFPDADYEELHKLTHIYNEAERRFLDDHAPDETIQKQEITTTEYGEEVYSPRM